MHTHTHRLPATAPRVLAAAALAFLLCPLARAQTVFNTPITITSSADLLTYGLLPALSTGTFTGGVITIAPDLDITFDSAGATGNRLTLYTSNTATFILDDNSTLTFSHNKATSAGGAVNYSASPTQAANGLALILSAAPTSRFVFTDNTSTGAGGAISVSSNSKFSVNNALFQSNTSTGINGGGAIANTGNQSVSTIISATFRNNYTSGGNGGGGAISTNGNNVIISATDILFDSNTATNNGGAFGTYQANALTTNFNDVIFSNNTSGTNGGGAYISYNSTTGTSTFTNVWFDHNTARAGVGGASDLAAASTFLLTGGTFTYNTAGAAGGAIQFAAASSATLSNILFDHNTAGGNGGAVNFAAAAPATISSATFSGNTATGLGGGLYANGGALLTISDALFSGNTATSNGGGISIGPASGGSFTPVVFTNVSLLDNHSGADGGGLYLANSNASNDATFTYNVTAGNLAQIAGNTAARGAGIYVFNAGGPQMTFNIVGQLDQVDPFFGNLANNKNLNITKNGAGTWNLGGSSTFWPNNASPSTINSTFTVAGGTLHLYRAGETSGTYTAATGNITYANEKLAASTNASFNFTLNDGATLSAGGGNRISTVSGTISLGANSTIALDLLGASPTAAILTLDATTLIANGWTQTLDLLNTPAFTDADLGTRITLITLTGGGDKFSDPNSFTNIIGLPDDPLYSLRLDGNSTLYLSYGKFLNNILTWNAAGSNWSGHNWVNATATPTDFNSGDITNLAGSATPDDIAINVDAPVTTAGLLVADAANYTLTGAALTVTSSAGTFEPANPAAANGKLTLGAKADATGNLVTTGYTGTLTLANTANTFQSGIDILSGVLVGNDQTLRTGTDAGTAINIAAPATLIFNQTAAAAYATPLAGQGNLVKTGTAQLTLNADSTAFTGVTTINQGSLRLNNTAVLGGPVIVNATGVFGGYGTAASNVTVNTGGALLVAFGNIDYRNLSINGGLTLNDGSTLTYNALHNQLNILGNFSLLGTGTIDLPATTPGSYTLITDAGSGLTDLNWSLTHSGTLLDPSSYQLTLSDPHTLLLTFAFGANSILTWTAAATPGLWDESTVNWKDFSGPRHFTQGDIVNITGTAGAPAAPDNEIAIAQSTTAAAIYINGAQNYTFTGASLATSATFGELAGVTAASGKLILGKNADTTTSVTTFAYTGTLDLTQLTGPNNFTAGVEINTGALRIASTAQLGATLSNLTLVGASTAGGAPATLILANTTAPGGTADYTFASTPAAATQRLNLPANANAAIILDPATNLTITSNSLAANGAAINLAANSSLRIQTGANSTLTLSNNITGGYGAAIYTAGAATLLIEAADNSSITFSNNTSNNDGAAINTSAATNITLTATANGATGGGFLFTSNTINGASGNRRGAAIALNGGLHFIDSATFSYNTAAANGGALSAIQSATLTLANVLFTNNTGADGGAILANTNASVTINNALFQSNTAARGGALNASNTSAYILNDVSFLDNRATTSGGAIVTVNNYDNAITFNISPSSTSQVAGNTVGAANTPNSINLVNNTGLKLTINPAATDSALDMPDPMTTEANVNFAINKNGPGVWNLGGANTLGTAATSTITLNINQGTLHLYNSTQTTGTYKAATGNITITGTASAFTLKTGATLSAGGKNKITAPKITLEDNTNLILDLTAAQANTTAYSTLTLDTAAGGVLTSNWLTQNLTLLNLDTLTPFKDDTFNLITLTGQTSTLFTSASAFASITGLIDGYELQLNSDQSILQLLCTSNAAGITANYVLTWAGPANSWSGVNWVTDATTTPAPASFTRGDIINLSNVPDGTPTTIAIDTPAAAFTAGLYLSGTNSYTLTGSPINDLPDAGILTNYPAATGKLILGARASDDAGTLDIDPATAAFTGTLTLSNSSNTFAGGIDIHSGELVGNAANLATGTVSGASLPSPVTIDAPGVLTFNQTASGTYSAPITDGAGAGTLNKTGAATLTLAALNPFSGITNINEGALALTPAASLAGVININPAATLIAAGGATAGNVIVNSGATLQVGDPAISGLQNFTLAGALTLNPGATLLLDLSPDGATSDRITTATLDLSALNAGPATPATISLNSIYAGSYELIHYTTLAGAFDPATLQATLSNGTPITGRISAAITNPANSITLNVTISNTTIKWTGAQSGAWDSLTPNWAGSDTMFYNGDFLTFDDTATGTHTVVLSGNVLASGILVATATSYVFNGAGAITTGTLGTTITNPTGQLVKDGPGLLNLANGSASDPNNFTGGILINDGTLQGNLNSLVAPFIQNNATLVFNVAGTGTYAAPVTGTGALVKQAAGTLTLTSAAYTGGLNVRNGSLTLLNDDLATQGDITLAAGTQLHLASTTDFTFTHNLTGTGGLLSLDTAGHAVHAALAAPSAFTGTLALGASTFDLSANNANLVRNATLQLNAGNTTIVGSSTQTLAGLNLNGGKLIFTATVPADLAANGIIQTGALTLATGAIQVTIPAGNPAVASEGANLLLQASGVAITRLISSPITNGDATGLTLVDQTGALIDNTTAKTITITQNNANVATGIYNYALDAAGGLSVNYKLTTIDILNDATLTLASDPGMTPAQATLATTITGAGNLLIDATHAPITLASANTFTGATTLAAGSLTTIANNALGAPTNTLSLLGNSTLNLASTTQTLSTITTAPDTTLNLATGTLALANGGAIAGAITGAGALNLAAGTLDINRSNDALTATITIAAGATINLDHASGLGTGVINLDGTLNLDNTFTDTADTFVDTLANTISGNGILNLAGDGITNITRANANFAGQTNITGAVTAANAAALGAGAVNVAATGDLTYTAPGDIDASIAGDGTLNLAAATGVTTLTGNNTIANINALENTNIIAATPTALGNAATQINMTGAKITLAADNTILGNLNMTDSTLTFAAANAALGNVAMNGASHLAFAPRATPDAPFQTATIHNLAAADGSAATLHFNTDVGAGLSDTLDITGAITGAFTATITNTGAHPATDSTTLTLVQAASNNATIRGSGVLNFDDTMNEYTYDIAPDGSGAINLNIDRGTALGPVGGAIIANATGALPLTWFAELDTLSQRLGDLHIAPRDTRGLDLWMRGYTQRLNVNNKDTTAPFSETQYGTEVGADYGGRASDHSLATYIGLYAGIGSSSRNLATYNSRGDTASVHAGAYLTLITPSGWYADLVAKYNSFDNTFNAITDTNIQMAARYTTPAYGGSLEFGKRIALGDRWYVTPDVQAALARIGEARYTTEVAYGGENLSVAQAAVTSSQLRAGFALGAKFNTKSGAIIQPYATAHYAQQWTSGGSVTVGNAQTGEPDRHGPYKTTIQGSRIETGLGVNWQVWKTLQVYFEYDTSWAKDYQKPYGLSLGVNHVW